MSAQELPIVAIVGRPNVGKSRLFNRYAGERRALVEDQPGITRDRITAEIEVAGRRILIVDTAGLEAEPGSPLEMAVQAQAEAAVAQADAILLVVDGRSGLLPEDEEIARTLRRSDKPLALAVNKVDRADYTGRTAEFHRLGLVPMDAISAEHGMGCFDVLEELVAAIPPPPEDASDDDDSRAVRLALVGRPNVGKSSLANRLAGEERVVVSDEPGTTRDRIEMAIERDGVAYLLMDTAGLRRPGRRDRPAERGSALMSVRSLERADVALLVVDASEGLTDQDAHVAAEVCERGCATVVLANKWDLVSKGESASDAKTLLADIAHGLRFLPDVQIVPMSAKTGARVGRVFPAIEAAANAAGRRVSTTDLNRWLQHVVQLHTPAATRGSGGNSRPVRFLYATQTGVKPPTFLFFCSNPTAVQDSYRRYLENKLREAFDFAGTPIRIRLRARREERDPGGKPPRAAKGVPAAKGAKGAKGARGGKSGGRRGGAKKRSPSR
jgi:GTP-binding protein